MTLEELSKSLFPEIDYNYIDFGTFVVIMSK